MIHEFQRGTVGVALALALGGCGAKEPASTSPGTGGAAAGGVGSGGTSAGFGGAVASSGGTTLGVGGSTSVSMGGMVTSGGTSATGGNDTSSGGTNSGGAVGGRPSGKGGQSAGGTPASSGGASAAGSTAGGAGGATSGTTKSAGCGVTDHPASGTAMIDVSGTQREYILKLPANYDPQTAYKLVFGWHWRGGQASDVASGQLGGGPYYGLEKLSNGSTIFVAPNGIDNGWANTGGRDLAFLRAMLELFNSKLCIDRTRIFSTGFSYGGMMSDAIGCDMADVFRAIAPMSGALYSGCTRSNTVPIAVWLSHGNTDNVVPLADGKTALDVFLKKNGCGSQTMAVTPSPCVAYEGCSAGHPVHYCEFAGGHQPPSFASSAIWQFFSQF
jgi:polyhydroxybutyrate depolymerase